LITHILHGIFLYPIHHIVSFQHMCIKSISVHFIFIQWLTCHWSLSWARWIQSTPSQHSSHSKWVVWNFFGGDSLWCCILNKEWKGAPTSCSLLAFVLHPGVEHPIWRCVFVWEYMQSTISNALSGLILIVLYW
jgi:hypothetical protein